MTLASAADRHDTPVDAMALDDALARAATQIGRLSDDQVRALRRRRRGAVAVPAVTAAALLLTIGGVGRLAHAPSTPAAPTRTFATAAGQRGTATLADGTTIKLDGATRLEVRYTAARRDVRLLGGQAFFDVRHDAARPFVVRAGDSATRVLGTAFDLDVTRRQVALAVYRGAVGFGAVEPGRPGMARRVVVRAGYRTRLSAGAVETPVRFDAALPGWSEGWIDATGMRLDDLVERLGRQSDVAIVPPTGALAALRITGRFRTDRPRALLGAIGEGSGFTVADSRGGLVLRARD